MAACPKNYGRALVGDRDSPFTGHMNGDLHSEEGPAAQVAGVPNRRMP